MTRTFLNRFVAELVVIVAVIGIFSVIKERLIAGAVAGSVFIALGLFVIAPAFKSAAYRRSFTFYAGCAHLLLSALPLFITRLLNAASDFQNVSVLGLPGPVFHRVSTGIYMLLLIATAIDLIRTWWRERAAVRN